MPETILVVDYDRIIRKGLGKLLSGEGFLVEMAGNGREAMHRYEEVRPRLVFLDAAMPDVSGFEVCDFIRNSEWGDQTTVVFLSGASAPSMRYTMRCATLTGGDQFIRKPYEPESLIDLVRKVMAR